MLRRNRFFLVSFASFLDDDVAADKWPEWLSYWVTDARVMGILAWTGLFMTLTGFGIALVQIAKIKTASRAAAEAIASLSRKVRLQEQSGKISDALRHLISAQSVMRDHNPAAASAHLSVGWTTLLAARELCATDRDRREVGRYVLAAKRLLDDINHPVVQSPPSEEVLVRRHEDISRAVGGLGEFSARLNVLLLGLGMNHE